MIKQNIDALAVAMAFLQLSKDLGHRHSLLDLIACLYINEHPGCGKRDICEFMFGSSEDKSSSLDKPLKRLVEQELVSKTLKSGVSTKAGNVGATYEVTLKGQAFLASKERGPVFKTATN